MKAFINWIIFSTIEFISRYLNACLDTILSVSLTLYSNVQTSLSNEQIDALKLKSLLAEGLEEATVHWLKSRLWKVKEIKS